MKKVISFSLFGHEDRYWQSLPCSLIAYNYAYPEYTLHLYIADDATSHKMYDFLTEIAKNFSLFKINNVHGSYSGTEPTTWRMMPMWENDVELFFCRDLDSLPTSDEKKATEVFLSSNYAIHGIRSYCLHNIDLMAGLCGFKSFIIKKILFCKSYQEYREFALKSVPQCKNWEWGCDQMLLRRFFFSGLRGRYCSKLALDTMIGSANKVSWYRGNQLNSDDYNIDVNKWQDLWNITDKSCKFLAEPSHYKSDILKSLLGLDTDLSRIIKNLLESNDEFKKYFLGEI